MVKKEKRLKKMRQNPKNVRYEDLISVLIDYGFLIRDTGGSHRVIERQIEDEIHTETIVQPHGGKKHVNRTYVKKALKLIDAIIEAEAEQEDDDNGDTD